MNNFESWWSPWGVVLVITLGAYLAACAAFALQLMVFRKSRTEPHIKEQSTQGDKPTNAIQRRFGLFTFICVFAVSVLVSVALFAMHLVLLPDSMQLEPFASTGLAAALLFGVAPALALTMLGFGLRYGQRLASKSCCILVTLLFPIGVYAILIEPKWIAVEHTVLETSADARVTQPTRGRTHEAIEDANPLRMVVLADIQTSSIGAHEQHAPDLTRKAVPDIIVVPGDIYQARSEHDDSNANNIAKAEDAFRAYFSALSDIAPTFVTPGNAEWGYNWQHWLTDTGVVSLHSGDTWSGVIAGQRLLICGVGMGSADNRPYADTQAGLAAINRLAQPSDTVIVLAHDPAAILSYPENARVNLTVSGHTHGGQVQIPFLGPIFTATKAPRSIAAGGLHTHNSNNVYVSRGVGSNGGQLSQSASGADLR